MFEKVTELYYTIKLKNNILKRWTQYFKETLTKGMAARELEVMDETSLTSIEPPN